MNRRPVVAMALVLTACASAPNAAESEPCRTCPMLDHPAHSGDATTGTASTVTPASQGTLGTRIAAAPPFARVTIPAGVYREPTITITRPVELVADSGAILDGDGLRTVIVVQADDVTIRGLTIRNTGSSQIEERAGIRVRNANRCVIAGNRFENTAFGIYLEETTGCVVRENVLRGTGASQSQNGNGIHAWSSSALEVVANDVRGHRDGIYFEFVQRGRVAGNRSLGNTRYGLHFMFSNDCEYSGNTYRGNGNGVAVMYSARVAIRDNTFERNRGSAAYGLLLKDINESSIDGNRFIDNSVALHLEGANRNHISRNTFSGNGVALRVLANAQDNAIEQNDFVRNAFDVATNSRSNYSTMRGNFWDRYRGYDLNRDGTGDVPHAPVTLFGLVVEQTPAALLLLRSPFAGLLDLAERAFPALTPSAMRDVAPRIQPSGAP